MGSPQNYVSITRRPPDIEDYIDMMRRYRSWIIGPMFAGLVISVVVAFLWPDTYISQAVMRITPQQVSERLLPQVVSTQMGERINQMEQEILSRTSLQQLIMKPSLNLYKKERDRLPLVDIVEAMRNKYIKIQMIMDPTQGGGPRQYATAFQISYSYRDRYLAQAVVNELVAKFMEQNVTVQRNQAQTTDSFLSDELKKAKDELDASEAALTKFRMGNQGKLPEQLQANMQAQLQLQMSISALDEALGRDHQDKLILETHLKNLKSRETFTSSNLEESVSGPSAVKNQRLVDLNNRIAEGKSTLAGLQQTFKDNYPDIQTYKARIRSLEKERDTLEQEEQLRQAANSSAGPTTVVNRMAAQTLQDIKGEQATTAAQIVAKQADIEAKTRRQAELSRNLAGYQTRIEGSTGNQQEYEALLREYNLAKAQYEEKSRRKDISETAKDLEDRKAGENLEVLDPASLPEQPSEPNRWAIAGVGAAVGLMFGVVLAGAKEVKNTSLDRKSVV
jgi:polysaccharide biosynthesis transport protein